MGSFPIGRVRQEGRESPAAGRAVESTDTKQVKVESCVIWPRPLTV